MKKKLALGSNDMTCYTDVILLIYSAINKTDTLDKKILLGITYLTIFCFFPNDITMLSILNLIWIVIIHVELGMHECCLNYVISKGFGTFWHLSLKDYLSNHFWYHSLWNETDVDINSELYENIY